MSATPFPGLRHRRRPCGPGVTALVAAACLAGVADARAEPPPPAARWVGAPVLPVGRNEAAIVHEFRLSTFFYLPGEVGDAWATGVDLAYGLTPRLTVGVGHSARQRGTVDHGGGWCYEGPKQRCEGAYAGALVDARLRVHAGRRVEVAALARAGAIDLGPVRPAVRLGVSVRAGRGRWWIVAEPEVQVSLGHRELGNRDTLVAPLWLGVGRRRAAAWIQTGARGQTVGLGEKLEIPFVLGGGVSLGSWRVGVEAGWPALLGPQNTFNVRHGALFAAAAF